ncbi:MAG TPA: integrin alpha, partial [Solirubrobacteraceae bacterium]|nr:integrin alpha [Solirubrobacteraceae bacterium]
MKAEPRRLGVMLVVALSAIVAASAPAQAATVSAPRAAAQVLVGEHKDDLAGASVAPAGDVNGGGREDVIVGAPLADPAGRTDAGSAYVVFSGGARGRLDLGSLGTRGFRIDGAVPLPPGMRHVGSSALTSGAGAVVAGLGDVDGDGLGDVAVSGREPGPFGGTETVVFVVFGSRDTVPVDLGALGERGFVIRSGGELEVVDGRAAGDVNGDGRADIAVRTFVDGDEDAGSVAVVLGRPGPAAVSVGSDGADGTFRISGGLAGMQLGRDVAPAGNVDRDGYGDLLLGAPGVAGGRGAVIVLHGSPR